MSDNDPGIIDIPTLDQPDAWETSYLFNDVNTPEIPATMLTDCLCDFACALANATETPEALSVMMILGILSTVLSKKFIVSPKEGWHEPVNIYTIVALPPANNKSLVLKTCTKPLIKWEREKKQSLEAEIKRHLSQRKTQEKIIDSMRIKASKISDLNEQQNLINSIAEKEASLAEPPIIPVLFNNDVTSESLVIATYEQKGKFAVISDEGGILETLAGLYSHGSANIDILLKGIDGGEIRVRRKDRNISVNPFLTIALVVQPSIIQNMGDKRAYFGNGALERFLYALPNSKLGYRTHDKPSVTETIQNAYENKIKSLLDIPFLYFNGEEMPYKLTLSISALKLWSDFQADVEKDLRPEGRLSCCQGWGGKISGFALRIAGLLHIAKHGCHQLIIDDEIMLKAVEISLLLIEHAIAAYGLMSIDQTTQDAKEVFKWIKNNGKLYFTQSDVTFAFRNRKLRNTERLSKAISQLIYRNIISHPQRIQTRKPTTIYFVNPKIISEIT